MTVQSQVSMCIALKKGILPSGLSLLVPLRWMNTDRPSPLHDQATEEAAAHKDNDSCQHSNDRPHEGRPNFCGAWRSWVGLNKDKDTAVT